MDVSKEQLLALIKLAEDSLYVRFTEFSNNPTDEDRELMLAAWRLAGKEVPEVFAKMFGWSISEVKPDGRQD